MRFSLVYVSDKPSKWAEQACAYYLKRLPDQFKFSETRIIPVKRNKNTVLDTARAEEWMRISEKIKARSLIILLDERGQQLTSSQFSQTIKRWQLDGQDVCFVIAGADGVNSTVRDEVSSLLAFSRLTLPHELARVLLLEQLYRAWSILENHPYHRD